MKTLIIDKKLKRRNSSEPLFISKSVKDSPYYAFPLIPETETKGFTYGAITDFLEYDDKEGCKSGDGYVQAPDGSRAGLIWQLSDQQYVTEALKPDNKRWGVYNVGFTKPIKTIQDLVKNFQSIVPLIKEVYVKLKKST